MEKFLKLAEIYVNASQCTPILKDDIANWLFDIIEFSKSKDKLRLVIIVNRWLNNKE